MLTKKYKEGVHLPPEKIKELFNTSIVIDVQLVKFLLWEIMKVTTKHTIFTIWLCESEQEFYKTVCKDLIYLHADYDNKIKLIEKMAKREEETKNKILEALWVEEADF